MPPAQELIKSRPFSDAPDLAYVILSLSFIFVSGSFVACIFLLRRCRPTRGHALLCTTLSLPALRLRGVPRTDGKRVSFCSPTVSVLVERSTIVASSPLSLNIIPNPRPPSTPGRSTDFVRHSLGRSVSWGRATIRLFGLVTSTSTLAASVQQNFSSFINSIASSRTATANNDRSRHGRTAASLYVPCQLRSMQTLKPFTGTSNLLIPVPRNTRDPSSTILAWQTSWGTRKRSPNWTYASLPQSTSPRFYFRRMTLNSRQKRL